MFDKLLDYYRGTFDITENYTIGHVTYDAYGYCNITNAKYVLVKKAEIWRALCFEHVFFRKVEKLTHSHIDDFCRQAREFIEPQLIRKGERYPEKDHMYSYITGIFICDGEISQEMADTVKGIRFRKNYLATVRGYTELRVLMIGSDRITSTIVGNRAATELVKEYRSLL